MSDLSTPGAERAERAGSAARAAAVLVVLMALLAIVALAARGEAEGPQWTAPAAVRDYLLTVAFVVAVAVGIGALVFFFAYARLGGVRRPRARGSLLVSVLLTLTLVTVLAMAVDPERLRPRLPPEREEPDPATQMGGGDREQTRPISFRWEAAAIAAAFMVAGGAAVYVLVLRRRTEESEHEPALAEALADVLADTLDDLRAERDARRAVIAAYARLERVLGARGLPRWAAEAPLEYLGRILRTLDVSPAAVLALTELFERAKFSRHDVDAAMKDEAIEALELVRDELRENESKASLAA